MIIFHEGLPGSGKSYEATVIHILPALQSGRKVITNIDGINYKKFSEITNLPESMLKPFLLSVSHEDIKDDEKRFTLQLDSFLNNTPNDSLVVIDEIQNLHPSGREKLSPQWSKYVTEHRHRGLDIILMGQDRRDCHNIWRRRIQRVITFNKLSVVGADNKYNWQMFEATRPEHFKKTTSGVRQYEKKYFGLYKSHDDGTDNKSNYNDKRALVWNNPGLKYGIPFVLILGFFGIKSLTSFFSSPENLNKETSKYEPISTAKATTIDHEVMEVVKEKSKIQKEQPIQEIKEQQQIKQEVKKEEYKPIDYLDELIHKHRPRLSGLIYNENKTIGYLDIMDSTFHLKERVDFQQLEELGWQIKIKSYGIDITKQDKTYVVTSWPIDPFGRVSQNTLRQPQLNTSPVN